MKMPSKSPNWLVEAWKYIGVEEVKGPKHSNVIAGWLDKLQAWWRDDETPWCGVFVAAVFQAVGITYPAYYMRAKAWLKWGKRIGEPVLGCVVVFDRKGGGHVGFVVGRDGQNNLWVLGGNQKNAVNVALFTRQRVLGYRIPDGFDYTTAQAIPLHVATAEFSRNEV